MHPTETIDRDSLRADIPDFRPGDTVKVHVRVVEGSRERVQVFQGAVMRRQGGGVRETFTVRKVSFGVGRGADLPRALAHHRQDRGRRPWATCAGPSSTTCASVREGRQDQGAAGPPSRRAAGAPMSEEDLERYEAEIELGLVQEYRAVLPVFAYVIETERRFYLANEVSLNGALRHHAGLHRARAARRLGLGHVPPGPLRPVGPRRHLPRREHRAPARTGALTRAAGGRPFSPWRNCATIADARAGRARTGPPAGTAPRATASSSGTGAVLGRDRPASAPRDRTCWSSARSRPGAPTASAHPARSGHAGQAAAPAPAGRRLPRAPPRRLRRGPLRRRRRSSGASNSSVIEGAF